MNMLSDHQLKAVLIEMHKAIEETAVAATSQFGKENIVISYPPNGGLTAADKEAISQLDITPFLLDAIRKIIADACAYPIFHLFSLMDGVADPENIDEPWFGCQFAVTRNEFSESETMSLHNEFYASYWDWRDKRRDKTWKLDNL